MGWALPHFLPVGCRRLSVIAFRNVTLRSLSLPNMQLILAAPGTPRGFEGIVGPGYRGAAGITIKYQGIRLIAGSSITAPNKCVRNQNEPVQYQLPQANHLKRSC